MASEYFYNKETGKINRPMMCPYCNIYRKSNNPTMLIGSQEFFFNTAGMCSICFDWINDPANKEVVDAIVAQQEKEDALLQKQKEVI